MAAVLAAQATARDPLDDLVLGDLQVQDAVQLDALLGEEHVERLGLAQVAREAVEQEAVLGVLLEHAVLGHPDGDLVRYQAACVHVALGLEPQRGALADVGAEQVAGGDVRDGQGLGEQVRLSTLPGPGRSDEDDTHQRRNPS